MMPDQSTLETFGQMISQSPMWVKLSLSAAVAFGVIGALGLFFTIAPKPTLIDAKTSNHAVTSTGQTGGITAHSVDIKK
jgi:hypothetical protein